MNEIWAVVHAEREALIRDLESLPAERWVTPSLCPGWDVHDVVAHLADDAKTTRLNFLRRFAAARFDFDRYNKEGVARERADEPQLTLAAFRAASHRTTSAPAPKATRLVEAFVHGEDIRRPLGLSGDYPVAHVATALRFQLNTRVATGGGKERAHGLHLIATDASINAGEGPEVRGTALALLLAVSGRPIDPDELTGPGAAALTETEDFTMGEIDATFTTSIVADTNSGLHCVRMPGSADFFGTGRAVKVAGTVDGHAYEATMLPIGGRTHMMPLRAPFRKIIGKGMGDEVTVHLTHRFS